MQFSTLQILAIIFTYLLFGFFGYHVSGKIKRPISIVIWIVLAVATLAAPSVMPGTVLLGLGEFSIYINCTIQAIGLGVIIGLATREIRIKFGDKKSS